MRADLEARVTAAVTDYLGYEPGTLALVADHQHPACPVACRVTGGEFPTDFLVHAPYTAETVVTWPPLARS